MKFRMSNREAFILSAMATYSLYAVVLCVKHVREGRKERDKIRREAAIDIKATLYAGEQVSERIRNGEYRDDLQKLATDMNFFHHIKTEELRDSWRKIS